MLSWYNMYPFYFILPITRNIHTILETYNYTSWGDHLVYIKKPIMEQYYSIKLIYSKGHSFYKLLLFAMCYMNAET